MGDLRPHNPELITVSTDWRNLEQPANQERFRRLEDDDALIRRMRTWIYGRCIAAAFVVITVYRYLGEM